MGHYARVVALATAAGLSISAAQAKEIRYPAAQPKISMIVPNDWKVVETPLGLEMQSPENDSLVLAAVSGADKASVEAWSKRALERMRGAGVVFAQTGPARLAAPKSAGPSPGVADAGGAKGAAGPRGTGATDFALMNGDRPYTFGDSAPSVALPPVERENKTAAARIGDVDLTTISDFALGPDAGAMKPSGHFLYAGGNLRGQPVDVELTLFPFGKTERVLFEQQSGPLDARGVKIMRSLRDLTR